MQNFFYGWYLKCQSEAKTLAVIPAVHQAGRKRICSIQIITEDNSWIIQCPGEVFRRIDKTIHIGENCFSEQGIRLNIQKPELTVKGELIFGSLSPLKYDIMGPFALVPFMECSHSVWSMKHLVNGVININGKDHVFKDACGYWEGDRGRSFPKEYLWTQCCFEDGSLMLSVADIPIIKFHFTGIIGVIFWKGKEYRLATYLGAKVKLLQDRTIRIVQGNIELEAKLLESACQALKAPTKGDMVRTIRENVACRAFYRFQEKEQVLFEFETDKASFEYEYHIIK